MSKEREKNKGLFFLTAHSPLFSAHWFEVTVIFHNESLNSTIIQHKSTLPLRLRASAPLREK
jgi:hypothetical protein